MSEVIIKELKASYSGHNSNLVKDWNREIIYGDGQWGIWLYWGALYPEDKIATKVTDKYNEGHDQDGALGQVLRHVLCGNVDMARSSLRLLISDDEVREMADELVRPLADKYVESIKEDEE